ncbi:spondin domain-containing protein [Roseofilum reptotaenium CS-1145]|uniref:CHRD domain-containing protein n=1 Tax=Roseofilum reptotaenium AO1-A TaxID=1925591 RepID=A0A1L9QQU7_9CYAN|nr:spondin domain-containing protein [Roseofilum reptotaenium]MDB9516102.1 spondin domain-containing protein [Roseofilum reptotaenium CS-1145]OJJ25051.1 hypothetical protein BI308_13505 [Roseofilum reptotaenium AO1-A]
MPLNQVTVTIENAAPNLGTSLTPFWVGFHNGRFDTYDRGAPASPGLEQLAEDGNNNLISQEFANSGFGNLDATIGSAPIPPGATVRQTFNIDASQGRYFNYASMILPSNDTFVANGNPLVHEIFDANGNFVGADILISGSQALDAGTEVNDEIPANTAFFGQTTPNTGVDQNGTIQLATGFNPVGSGGILDDSRFTNADYTAANYQIARIRVTSNPSARLSSVLTGAQEVPPTTSNATGTSQLILNEFGDALSYELNVSGLDFGQIINGTPQTADPNDDVTRIHIHNGARGANGPVVFGLVDLITAANNGQDSDDLQITQNANGSVTLRGIWEESDSASTPLSQFVSSIQTAQNGADIPLYWNVHTTGSPAGAIRGQLQDGNGTSQTVNGLQTQTITLGSNQSLAVNAGGRLDVEGTAVAVNAAAQNVSINVQANGLVDGSFNGVNFANGGQSQGTLTNNGIITSASRAVNLGGLSNQIINSGQIVTTANPRNGTIYSDQTARGFSISNTGSGLIDTGSGNQGDAISLQLGASVTGGITNAGTIFGRGPRSSTTNSESSAIRLYWGNESGSPASIFTGNITNSGTLFAEQGSAVLVENQTILNGEIRNSGTIYGGFRGINFANGGSSGGSVVNETGGQILGNGRAINIGGGGVSVQNAGQIRTFQTPSDGVIYGDQTARVIVIDNQASGVIDLTSGTQGDAISLELAASVNGAIVNSGTISGAGAISSTTNSQSSAIRLYWGNQTGVPVSVFNGSIGNSGQLTSEQGATILIEDQTQLNGLIINTGLIQGGSSATGTLAIDTQNAEGVVAAINTGLINGDFLLSAGSDFYEGTQGSLFGSVIGGNGGDTLLGGASNDSFIAGAGNDSLNGGGGTNLLIGGTGSDTLISGNGIDIFAFGADLLQDPTADIDVIANFTAGDVLDFNQYLGAGGRISSVQTIGGNLNVLLSSNDSILIGGDIAAASSQIVI